MPALLPTQRRAVRRPAVRRCAWCCGLVAACALAACTEPAVSPRDHGASATTRGSEDPLLRLQQAKAQLAKRTGEGILASIVQFEALLDQASAVSLPATNLAEMHAGLAEASALAGLYSLVAPRETMPRAKRAAEAALALEPEDARTLAALGLVEYLWSWDFPAAEQHLQRAIATDPQLANASLWYGMLLAATGRSEEAVAQALQAQRADPASRLVKTKAITIFVAANQLARARQQFSDVVAEHGVSALALRELGFLEIAAADSATSARASRAHLEAALSAFERANALQSSARSTAALAYVHGRLGTETPAAAALEALQERADDEFTPALYLALAHLGVGDRETALVQIESAFEMRDPGLVYLRSRPGLRDLRGEERYERVAREVGL